MAAPTNISPATATAVTSGVPIAQRVDDAGITYTVWFKYTNVSADAQVIGFWYSGDIGGGGYRPTVNLYADEALDFYLSTGTENGSATLPILPGATFYFEIENDFGGGGDDIPSNLSFNVVQAAGPTSVPGLVFIPLGVGDTENYIDAGYTGMHAGIIDAAASAIIGFVPEFPPGEPGDVFPTTGRIIQCDQTGMTGYPTDGYYFDIYSPDALTLLTQTPVISTQSAPICRVHEPSDKCYVQQNNIGGTGHIMTIDANGVLVDLHEFAASIVHAIQSIAVKNDESILYFGEGFPQGPLARWDLNAQIQLTDLAAQVSQFYNPDILVLPDDSVVACYHRMRLFWGTGVNQCFVRRYAADGTLLNTYSPVFSAGITSTPPRLGYSADPDAFWLFTHLATGFSDIRKIKASDGTELLVSLTPDALQNEIESASPQTPTTSDSCPILELRFGTTPPTVGTIIVTKVLDPTDSPETFDFTAGPDLDPPTFSLGHGDMQTYADIPTGTYAIEEQTLPDGWEQTSVVVSNGDPADAIELEDGDTVTVTVTNTFNGGEPCVGQRGDPPIGA